MIRTDEETVLTKEDFRGKRSIKNRTSKRFNKNQFEEEHKDIRAAGKKGHSRHLDIIEEIDEDHEYGTFADWEKYIK